MWERRWRTALTLALAIYGWQCLRTPEDYRWIDSLNLAIHETGHLVFAFDGEFLMLLGGTLLQLLVSAVFVVALWRQGDRHGATVPLGQLGWLERDQAIGGAVFLLGAVLHGVAIVSGWRAIVSAGESEQPAAPSAGPGQPGPPSSRARA